MKIRRNLAAVLLAVIAVSVSGCDTPSSTASALKDPFLKLARGDCFDSAEGLVTSTDYGSVLEAASCADTHDFQFLGSVPVEPEPDLDKLSQFVYDACLPLYLDFVGAESVGGAYFSLFFLYPSVEQSTAGITHGHCVVTSAQGAARGILGSAQGSGGVKS